jgi:transposase-like protein
MSKPKYSAGWKIAIAKKYLLGEGSYGHLSTSYGIDKKTLRGWVAKFLAQGELGFNHQAGNRHYCTEFKIKCVEMFLRGEKSVKDIVAKYNISSESVLRSWIMKYNANMELENYEPKREVYMAEARRKTTLEERKEIVECCISHNNDYKGTASKYDVSYSQVYTWVRKYQESGETGLEDKRGHHKSDNEVGELERLRRENLRLKRQLEEKDMLCELLKKVREFEGM